MQKQSRATAIANDIQFPLFLSAIKRLKLAAKFPKIERKIQNSKIISSTLSSGYPISLFTSFARHPHKVKRQSLWPCLEKTYFAVSACPIYRDRALLS